MLPKNGKSVRNECFPQLQYHVYNVLKLPFVEYVKTHSLYERAMSTIETQIGNFLYIWIRVHQECHRSKQKTFKETQRFQQLLTEINVGKSSKLFDHSLFDYDCD